MKKYMGRTLEKGYRKVTENSQAFGDKAVTHYMPGHPSSQQKLQRKNTVTRMAILEPIYMVSPTPATETVSDGLNTHGVLGPSVAIQCK